MAPRKPDSESATPKAHTGRADGEPAAVAVPRSWVSILVALLVVPWLIVGTLFYRRSSADTHSEGTVLTPAASTFAAPGPWGRLTITPIVISPPLEYISVDSGAIPPPMWRFPGIRPEALVDVLKGAGLPADDAARLHSTAQFDPRVMGLVVTPGVDLVRRLDPAVRARIYTLLAKSAHNFDQTHSFRYAGTSPKEWLGFSPISPATRALVEPLIYRDGGYLHFADFDLVRAEVTDPNELRRLAKALLRSATLKVELSVEDVGGVGRLAEYWGRGGRRTDIRPLLESIAGAPSGGSIDIVHLLPMFARDHLYRYPKITAADLDRPVIANCLWTSLNFFNSSPDDRFLDVSYALERLKRDYFIVEDGFELGDIVALLDAENNVYHVAVYLADGLVFTKNGTSPVAPWVIMSLERVTAYYGMQTERPRLIFHRRNGM